MKTIKNFCKKVFKNYIEFVAENELYYGVVGGGLIGV